ncbi:hypothetical protein PpBr36_05052 [Pyricularia pennisetigena]|uniref:hypothetical protein n=1 Tax=Pyricularia pennisetigena TaxID=1578925 RepID=UPI00114E5A36|nr:hypothetical protein PpBr36_05052 [Pyricularia pennisetigena]TLS27002.1 hypothetical protein PpBr36_05052 [Pyricularia pennisetigena]
MPTLTLYRSDGSCSMVPHILLKYLNIPHRCVAMQSNGGPRTQPHLEAADGSLSAEDYTKINHKGVVPTLVVQDDDGGTETIITELEAVTTYISFLAKDKHVYGRTPLERAKVMEWVSWLAGTVQNKGLTAGLAPYKFTTDEVGWPGVQKLGEQRMRAAFVRIDEKLRTGDTQGLGLGVDGYFTVADFYLYLFYVWGYWFKYDMADEYPALRDLVRTVEGLDVVREVVLHDKLKLQFAEYYALSRIYANRPHKLPSVDASFAATGGAGGGRHGILFTNRIRNCEDGIVVPELGVAFLSCDPGRDGWNTVMGSFAQDQDANPGGQIWLYRYSRDVVAADEDATMRLQRLGLSAFPEPKLFHPIGIAFDHPTATLFVLNNDVRGPRLEVFRYRPSIISPSLKHLGTIEHPLIYSPNSVEVVSSTELYITNDHRFPARYHPTLSTLENYLLLAKGSVVRVKLSSKSSTIESIRTVASLPFPNGIARLNESTMAVASTNTASIHFYSMPAAAAATTAGEKKKEEDGEEEQLALTGVVKLPFLPDNLSVDDKGKLLIAGHPSPPELNQVSRSRALCQDERARNPKAEEPKHCRKAMAPSWAAEWTEADGLRNLYVSRGAEAGGYGTTATAARDSARGLGFLTGLYDEGILATAVAAEGAPDPAGELSGAVDMRLGDGVGVVIGDILFAVLVAFKASEPLDKTIDPDTRSLPN